MDIDWDLNDEEDYVDNYYDEESDCYDMEDDYEKENAMAEVPVLHCSLCNCTMPDSGALITHVLSTSHNRRLHRESASSKDLLLRRLLKKKRSLTAKKATWKSKETVLTKRLKYLSPPSGLPEIEHGEIVENDEDHDNDDDDEDDDDDDDDNELVPKKVPELLKQVGKDR